MVYGNIYKNTGLKTQYKHHNSNFEGIPRKEKMQSPVKAKTRKELKINKLDEDESRLSQILFPKPSALVEGCKRKAEDKSLEELNVKPSVWHDEDDENFTAKDVGELYSQSLKKKYVNLVGTPSWAKLNKTVKKDTKQNSDSEDDQILQSVGHLAKRKHISLPTGRLAFKRFQKINADTGNEGPLINVVKFHPQSSVALVGGHNGTISLFHIGGEVSQKLHSVSVPNYGLLNAHFTPDGTSAILSSAKNSYFYEYNLMAATMTKMNYRHTLGKPNVFEMSPCGKYLAIVDGYDEIHIFCAKSKELLRTLKQSSNVHAVAFSPDSFKLYGYGAMGSVSIYSLRNFRIERKFVDQGCITGSCIAASSCGKYLATGSGEGVVNIYDPNNFTSAEPVPLRSIMNLKTKVTNLQFNSSSEILGMASNVCPDAIKLVHLPSYHVFSNMPEPHADMNKISALDFSPNSGYFAMSNDKNSAYLYRLRYYKNY